MDGYTENTRRYLDRLYDAHNRAYACEATDPREVADWQAEARTILRRLIGLENIEALAGDHRPSVELDDPEDMGDYSRRRGEMETEPDVRVPFWLLMPRAAGRFPLALTPHGHDELGYDISAGIAGNDSRRAKMVGEDRDVAVQAVRQGFVAIAPATRGIGCDGVPDVNGRHGGRACRSLLLHCLLAGRTPMGERVWDMARFMDWGGGLPNVDPSTVLMMGNSGGGMVTLYTAACDERVKIAIASCSYSSFVNEDGYIHHCDCNAVPGILAFGEFWDVSGLIAPRYLLTVNGAADKLHPPDVVSRAVDRLHDIYLAAGVPERYQHRFGREGHRFYKGLMWAFVHEALASQSETAYR